MVIKRMMLVVLMMAMLLLLLMLVTMMMVNGDVDKDGEDDVGDEVDEDDVYNDGDEDDGEGDVAKDCDDDVDDGDVADDVDDDDEDDGDGEVDKDGDDDVEDEDGDDDDYGDGDEDDGDGDVEGVGAGDDVDEEDEDGVVDDVDDGDGVDDGEGDDGEVKVKALMMVKRMMVSVMMMLVMMMVVVLVVVVMIRSRACQLILRRHRTGKLLVYACCVANIIKPLSADVHNYGGCHRLAVVVAVVSSPLVKNLVATLEHALTAAHSAWQRVPQQRSQTHLVVCKMHLPTLDVHALTQVVARLRANEMRAGNCNYRHLVHRSAVRVIRCDTLPAVDAAVAAVRVETDCVHSGLAVGAAYQREPQACQVQRCTPAHGAPCRRRTPPILLLVAAHRTRRVGCHLFPADVHHTGVAL